MNQELIEREMLAQRAWAYCLQNSNQVEHDARVLEPTYQLGQWYNPNWPRQWPVPRTGYLRTVTADVTAVHPLQDASVLEKAVFYENPPCATAGKPNRKSRRRGLVSLAYLQLRGAWNRIPEKHRYGMKVASIALTLLIAKAWMVGL